MRWRSKEEKREGQRTGARGRRLAAGSLCGDGKPLACTRSRDASRQAVVSPHLALPLLARLLGLLLLVPFLLLPLLYLHLHHLPSQKRTLAIKMGLSQLESKQALKWM
jgi:hypothetical protein